MYHDKTLVLAIDLGTSGPKVVAVNLLGDVVADSVQPVALYATHDGAARQSAREWWEAVDRGVREVVAKVDPTQIRGINCTAQWSGTVPLDENGKELCDALIWMDTTGAPYIQKLNDGFLKVAGYAPNKLWNWIAKTGGAPSFSGKDSVAHILYLREEHPEIYANTHVFLEPKDYLNWRLTGKLATSPETIALHWVTDNRKIENIRYDAKLLAQSGLDVRKLPPIYPTQSVLGPILPELAKSWGLASETPVVIGAPDLHAAAVGAGTTDDFACHLYIGTSSWISCHVPFKKTSLFLNIASLPSALPGKYLVGASQESAGLCLEYAKNLLFFSQGEKNNFEALEDLAKRSKAGCNQLLFTPWLNGERTPIEDKTLRGGFHNLSFNHSPPDFARSVYEGVAYNTKWLLQSVEKFLDRKIPYLNMIGGGAISAFWCQIFADILEVPIHQLANPRQANARGAAWLGAMALGLLRKEQIPELVEVKENFVPNDRFSPLYQKQYSSFMKLLKANQPLYSELNTHGSYSDEYDAIPQPVS